MSRPVDGGLGQPGGEQFLVGGGAVAAQVVGQGGPRGGGVPGSDARVGGGVDAEAGGQVGGGPGSGVAALVERGGLLVEGVDPFRRDGGGVGFVGPVELVGDLGVGGRPRGQSGADDPGDGQLGVRVQWPRVLSSSTRVVGLVEDRVGQVFS